MSENGEIVNRTANGFKFQDSHKRNSSWEGFFPGWEWSIGLTYSQSLIRGQASMRRAETSTWDQNADLLFSHLLALMYSNAVNSVCLYCDMSCHIADLKDYVGVKNISPRVVLNSGCK